jgi:hypothetical protein
MAPNERIAQLYNELNNEYHKGDPHKALKLAGQLASLLPNLVEVTGPCLAEWILVFEAQGNIERAIKLSAYDLEKRLSEIEAGDYEPYPKLLSEQLQLLQDGFYLQAHRYLKLAIKSLYEANKIAQRFGTEPDQDVQSLLTELLSVDK